MNYCMDKAVLTVILMVFAMTPIMIVMMLIPNSKSLITSIMNLGHTYGYQYLIIICLFINLVVSTLCICDYKDHHYHYY